LHRAITILDLDWLYLFIVNLVYPLWGRLLDRC